MTDSARSNFERTHGIHIVTPSDDFVMRANVTAALNLDLPEISEKMRGRRRLAIIANGPSAANIPDDAAAKIGDTLAVNGALAICRSRLLGATYWLTVDPQPLVAGFLSNVRGLFSVTRPATTYLVPSHASPTVFRALAGRDIKIWHAENPATSPVVPPASKLISVGLSSTLAAIAVARAIGYRNLDVWGWDCCYSGDRHHAADQEHFGDRQTVTIDGEKFETSATWIAECHDAVRRLGMIDARIHIHGSGMMVAAMRQAGAKYR